MTISNISKSLFASVLIALAAFSFYIYADANNQSASTVATVEFGRADIRVNGIEISVEYAHNFEQRARGLMYRSDLCANCGMLFEFEYARMAGFWMKNTLIPLDIAYIDSAGVIADIKPMYPLVLESVPSSRAILYALEMNQGWFAANNISVGDRIQITGRNTVK